MFISLSFPTSLADLMMLMNNPWQENACSKSYSSSSYFSFCLFISLHWLLFLFYFVWFDLFTYFWLCWVFIAAPFSLAAASRSNSPVAVHRFPMVMAPLVAEHTLWGTQASVVAARVLRSCGSLALGHRLSSCGAQAQLLHCTWKLPRSRIEPMSPALVSRFFTTEPPGKL